MRYGVSLFVLYHISPTWFFALACIYVGARIVVALHKAANS